ncbi:MAG: hypothetical protein QOK26_482 [Pseudonocardiales bacterium]|nr:hypothetical protein [Pseudonocardia sp.]MDT7598405.1 hypothetical protein [Pseudonocardiales bacterium]MDT7646307.1 hypothetical protein [Pseudonocardiales bacterium]MDT7656130.1 hypothetical protein [Pseudonocardiales bacterium]MDT7683267.1 hypothetical protein [Pseudonocardiales bacterium]
MTPPLPTDPDSAAEPGHPGHPARLAELRAWTGQRPWLGGALTVLAGLTIVLLPAQGFSVVLLPGVAGLSGFVIGGLIAACGLFLLFSPQLHGLIGIAAVLLSLVSFVTTNLGGLVVGMLLGIVGGSLGFAWSPPDTEIR